jgi:hypothetical protein
MINYNNKMKELLGNNLELMIRNRAFDRCSCIEEDGDQIYCTIHHSFDLYKEDNFENMLDGAIEVSEEYDRQSELYETQLILTKKKK